MPSIRQRAVSFFKNLFGVKQKDDTDQLKGSQRSSARVSTIIRRQYDLEIDENPVRDWERAIQLIELCEYCYEAHHSLSYATRDTFSSSDGDDRGWRIADTIDDEKTPVHPEVKAIAQDLADRKQGDDYVIGGDRLKKACWQAIGYGDSFLQIAIEKEGIGRNDYGISRSLYMPVWEMFRKESDTGYLEGYEQRAMLGDSNAVFFEPPKIIHIRNQTKHLYGRSIFTPAIEGYNAWTKAKDAARDLSDAIRAVGANPNLHIFPEGTEDEQIKEYKEDIRQNRLEGIQTDLFLMPGQDVRKMSNVNPELLQLSEAFLQWRHILIPAGFPSHFFPGLDARQKGAKEISGVPALSYQRMIWDWRSMLTKGVVRGIDTELILKKGVDFYKHHGRYRIEWASWQAIAYQKPDNNNNNNGKENGKQYINNR